MPENREPDILPLAWEDNRIRVVRDENGEPWFVAHDVCRCVGIGNVSRAVNGDEKTGDIGLDNDEKRQARTIRIPDSSSLRSDSWLVNEPGLYHLADKGRSEAAKRFQRWVHHEVLPSIRKYGYYVEPGQSVPQVQRRNKSHMSMIEYEEAPGGRTGGG